MKRPPPMSITPLLVGEVTNVLPYILEILVKSKGSFGAVILRIRSNQYHNHVLAMGKSNFSILLTMFPAFSR